MSVPMGGVSTANHSSKRRAVTEYCVRGVQHSLNKWVVMWHLERWDLRCVWRRDLLIDFDAEGWVFGPEFFDEGVHLSEGVSDVCSRWQADIAEEFCLTGYNAVVDPAPEADTDIVCDSWLV